MKSFKDLTEGPKQGDQRKAQAIKSIVIIDHALEDLLEGLDRIEVESPKNQKIIDNGANELDKIHRKIIRPLRKALQASKSMGRPIE